MIDGRNAMEALDSRNVVLKGRRLIVNEAYSLSDQVHRPRYGRTPRVDITQRLYVAGLPYSATETSVRSLFQNHGLNPVEVHLPKDRQTRRQKKLWVCRDEF